MKILPEYQLLSRKTTEEVIIKKGKDLAFRFYQELKKLKPEKGAITTKRLAELKGGNGIKVRPGVIERTLKRETTKRGGFVMLKDKAKHIADKKGIAGVRFRSNDANWWSEEGDVKNKEGLSPWQIAVRSELKARESGRGYTAYSTLIGVQKLISQAVVVRLGYNKQTIGSASISRGEKETSVTFKWGEDNGSGKPASSGDSLSKPRQQAAIAQAIADSIADIKVYLARKHGEALEGAVSSAIAKTPMKRI